MASAPQNGKLFSCGNHSVETTKGILYFGDSPSQTLCILGVPTTMTARDVIQFLNPSTQELENTRIIREVNLDSSYIVTLKFRSEDSAKDFYLNYDGVQFNSLEDHTCKLLYVTRTETFVEDPAKMEETSNCAVCLDRMYPDKESIITILCNHSFHSHCLGKWSDTSCPVCRYCQTPECQVQNKCMDCSYEGESLWMCILCGNVACGRYINGHAYDHFSQTQHTYAMQLADNQVWDYAGDNYVHRLLANKSDGKPVEVEGAEAQRQAEEKIEAVQLEYTYLITQQLEQLESQRKHYEKSLRDNEKQYEKKLKDLNIMYQKASNDLAELQEKHSQTSRDKATIEKKLNTIQNRLAKILSNLAEEREINKCLTLNQQQLQQKLKGLEEEVAKREVKIRELEEGQRDLMFYLEGTKLINESVDENKLTREEANGSTIVMESGPSTSQQPTSKHTRRKKR